MNNTLLIFEKEELDEFIVSNYFSKKTDLYNLLEEFKTSSELSTYFSIYQITDNDKLERISYDIYGTSNYWDLLLSLNDKSPLFDMSYDLDTLSTQAEEFWEYYKNVLYFQAPLDSDIIQSLIDEEVEKMKINNEIHRYMYIINPSKLHDFLKILRQRNYII